ncbi:MAG: RNA polymerase sigma factor [Myxococcota bacterium]
MRGEVRPLISLVRAPAEERKVDEHPERSGYFEQPAQPREAGRLEAALARHIDFVWRVLRRTGLPEADAEEAAQDTFWVFARRLDSVPVAAERSFLVSTALRLAADRRRAKWYSSSVELDSDTRASDGPLPDEAVDLRRARALIDGALASLSPAERDVFVLTELEEMPRPEVARVLEISEGTVASRLARARERFHAALKRLGARRPTNPATKVRSP